MINELLTTYSIEGTLNLSSKMEGPKYLSNLVDGSSSVLRIYQSSDIKPARMEVYKKIVGFDLY